jgi:hypothetical protein
LRWWKIFKFQSKVSEFVRNSPGVVAAAAADVVALVATIRRFGSIQGTPLYFPYKRRALEVVKMRVNTDPKQPKKCWTSESS